MVKSLEIKDYYTLIALHRALFVTRFAENPVIPELSGSPFLAKVANEIVEILSQMEIEKGRPERANNWRLNIKQGEGLWLNIVGKVSENSEKWRNFSYQQKREIAYNYLSPFILDEDVINNFVNDVDKAVKKL